MNAVTFSSSLLSKTHFSNNTFELKYRCPKEFSFIPGQFITMTFEGNIVRAYSIVAKEEDALVLLVNTNPGGVASKYFDKVQVGSEINIKGPYGIFALKQSVLKKVFISTSTGVAPFISMVNALASSKQKLPFTLYFGERYLTDDYVSSFYLKPILNDPRFKYFRCITRETPENLKQFLESGHNPLTREGRVTKVVFEEEYNFIDTEFYLCGSKEMIFDVKTKLLQNGATKIYAEKFN